MRSVSTRLTRFPFLALLAALIVSGFAAPAEGQALRNGKPTRAAQPPSSEQDWPVLDGQIRPPRPRVIAPPRVQRIPGASQLEPTLVLSRNPAEFEPMQGVLIRYPLGIPYPLVAALSEDDTVYTLVANQTQENQAAANFAAQGVNMSNVVFVQATTDSHWTRDYGPWYVYTFRGEAQIQNHIYERYQYRPNDNMIPLTIGGLFRLAVHDLDLITAGGNFQSDGHGTALITRKVYDWTPLTEQEIDTRMQRQVGIDRHVCLPYFDPNGLHHIDCWAKLLTPEKVLVKRVPVGNAHYERIEANVRRIAALETCFGRPYEILRVDEVGDENYTNCLILNDKIYVPTFQSGNDALAMSVFASAMPGYDVRTFGNWYWYDSDALHCRTKELPNPEMLYIDHAPLRQTDQTSGLYQIEVRITDYSRAGLITSQTSLFWRVEGTGPTYTETPLIAGLQANAYTAEIPAQPLGSTLSYYLRSADYSGRTEYHPAVGALGPHSFEVALDTQAPEILHDPQGDVSSSAFPLVIEAVVRDDVALPTATFEWSLGGIPQLPLTMVRQERTFRFEATLAGPIPQGSTVSYRIVAGDGVNTTYEPAVGMHAFDVVGLQPLLLWNPDPTPSSGSSVHTLLTGIGQAHDYVASDTMPTLANYANVFVFLGVYTNNRALTGSEADALATYLNSGGNVYMEGGDCWNYDASAGTYRSLFGIQTTADGTGDVSSLNGVPGTLADGMAFSYTGENNYMDEISPSASALTFLLNPGDGNGHAISCDTLGGRTIAASFELGGLADGSAPSTKTELLQRYRVFFGL